MLVIMVTYCFCSTYESNESSPNTESLNQTIKNSRGEVGFLAVTHDYQKDNHETEFLYQRQSVHSHGAFQIFVAVPILVTHTDTDLSSTCNNVEDRIFLPILSNPLLR